MLHNSKTHNNKGEIKKSHQLRKKTLNGQQIDRVTEIFTSPSGMSAVVLTFICSLNAKYLPETLSAPISWIFICSWLQSCGALQLFPNSSSYCSETWVTVLPTWRWKSSTACRSTHQRREFNHKASLLCVYISVSMSYPFCFAGTRWKLRSGWDQCFDPAGNRDILSLFCAPQKLDSN